MALAILGAAPAHATTVTMTGVVHTVCEANFNAAPTVAEGRSLDLGALEHRCNNAEGYRMIIHTPEGIEGAVFVIGGRQVPLSRNGTTLVIDSNRDERASEPARILFATSVHATAFPIRVEMVPKGAIY